MWEMQLHSKWFMKSIGHEGLNNLLMAYEDKSAKAVCTFGFSKGPGHEPILFQGITDVSIFVCGIFSR
jgi:inosine triphosphate pyrophosphatase